MDMVIFAKPLNEIGLLAFREIGLLVFSRDSIVGISRGTIFAILPRCSQKNLFFNTQVLLSYNHQTGQFFKDHTKMTLNSCPEIGILIGTKDGQPKSVQVFQDTSYNNHDKQKTTKHRNKHYHDFEHKKQKHFCYINNITKG